MLEIVDALLNDEHCVVPIGGYLFIQRKEVKGQWSEPGTRQERRRWEPQDDR